MADLTHTALGTWSGGRFLHFGEPVDDERLAALIRPDGAIPTVITADVYGSGEADRILGEALRGLPREDYVLVGAIGHDFYEGERDGPKGFPRFTDPSLRSEDEYAAYIRMATEASLARCGVDEFDLLLLHNPDRTGYTSPAVWEGMEAMRAAGRTRLLGVAPGPANGFTLDVIECFERFGGSIDWAMIILNPFEPWPGELVLPAAHANGVKLITRVVDYGGLFHDDVAPGHEFAKFDHRSFRPPGWVEAGRERLERVRPIAERHGLTMLQLACQWNLAHDPVGCVVPTLIQEIGPGARPVEEKRAELAAVPREVVLTPDEVAAIREIGDNAGCMRLKGASPEHDGPAAPDRWPLDESSPTSPRAGRSTPTPRCGRARRERGSRGGAAGDARASGTRTPQPSHGGPRRPAGRPAAGRPVRPPGDPLELLRRWLDEAGAQGMKEPSAMTLATVTPDGRPSARVVLLKGHGEAGSTFFTNYRSRKGEELVARPFRLPRVFTGAASTGRSASRGPSRSFHRPRSPMTTSAPGRSGASSERGRRTRAR